MQLAGIDYQQSPQAGLLMGFGAIENLDVDISPARLRDILQQVA